MKCAVGITAGARSSPTLDQTAENLKIAGFPSPRIFVDGIVKIPED